jgi:hypothetical protein
MSDAEPLVTVATFDSLTQAELARGVLDAEGIRSFLADAETVNMTWSISGAVGGIKLQVAKSDFLPAERALHTRAGKPKTRGLDDYGLANRTAITNQPFVVCQDADEPARSNGNSAITDQPGVVQERAADDDDAIAEDNEAEVMVRAALRAALLGLFLLPPLLHIYSLLLLGSAKELQLPLGERYRKMFKFTAVLDVVMVLIAVLLLLDIVIAIFTGRAVDFLAGPRTN